MCSIDWYAIALYVIVLLILDDACWERPWLYRPQQRHKEEFGGTDRS